MSESQQYSSFREAEQDKNYDFPQDHGIIFKDSYFSWIRPRQRKKEDKAIERFSKPSLTERVRKLLPF